MVMHHRNDGTVEITDMDAAKAAQATGDKAGEGAAIGAIAGGLGGGAVALALGMIPGVGPVLTLGTARWLRRCSALAPRPEAQREASSSP